MRSRTGCVDSLGARSNFWRLVRRPEPQPSVRFGSRHARLAPVREPSHPLQQEMVMASLHTSQPRQPGIRELVDQKAPLKLKDIWAFQVRVQLGSNVRGLALFNLAIEDRCRRGRRLPGPGSRAGRVRGWDPRSSRVGRFHPRAGGMGSAPVPVRDASVPVSGGPLPITHT